MFVVNEILSGKIKKPTALVHYERKLSIRAQKLITLIVFHLQAAEKKDRFYYISKKFVRKYIKGDSANKTNYVHDTFKELYDENNDIKWNFFGKDFAFKDLTCKFLISIGIPSSKGHYYAFQVHPDLEESIKKPNVYSSERIIMMSILKDSKYAYPLYDLLLESYSRKEKVLKISLEELRSFLGVPVEAYRDSKGFHKYVDFKKYVLKPCLLLLNKETDLKIEFKTYRKGRRVDGLYFTIEKKMSFHTSLSEELKKDIEKYYKSHLEKDLVLIGQKIDKQPLKSEEQDFVTKIFKKYKVDEATILKAIEKYSLEGVNEIKEYAIKKNEKSKKDDFTAYLATCFKRGYGLKSQEEREKEKEKLKKIDEQLRKEKKREDNKKIVDELKNKFAISKDRKREEVMKSFSKDKREALKDEFLRNSPSFIKSQAKISFNRKSVQTFFDKFLNEKFLNPDELDFVKFAEKNGVKVKKNSYDEYVLI
ncbi:MAG: hypothetical protein OMM_10957 [Candidatus Magnetoglobus multicellularis str. Araruama]|uniref:Initiator Rep protein WH1 domain-containing protein n=1 Tax=Candidatus Magnetoglobus multicellularis str. Araruama TaxID=890399 RepID=A0A1V1NZP9_9BACT|nr:MAG: hypothetical protein OMM_10957 [Candidatus Magnetoglobus multicellularis str. Araruama]